MQHKVSFLRRQESTYLSAKFIWRFIYNNNWQVLSETNADDVTQRWFIYGNYIDEVLLMKADGNDYYYAQDHLYSPAALIDSTATVIERYEYDAYGNPTIWDGTFQNTRETSNYGNPYLFTGRRVDTLDNGSLKIQYNRNRYYDYYTGRWLTQDPLGYADGMNLYEYITSNPVITLDPYGQRRWLGGKPDVSVGWTFIEDWYYRSTFDGKCRHFTSYDGSGKLGVLITPFWVTDIAEKDPIGKFIWDVSPSVITSWAKRLFSMWSVSGVASRWHAYAMFYSVDWEVSDCPRPCECKSECCRYDYEKTNYALDYVWYVHKAYEDEIVLTDKKTLVKNLIDAVMDIFGALKVTK